MRKSFDVVGNRAWKRGLLGASAGFPEPFVVMPFSYDRAFGGSGGDPENPSRRRTVAANHAGVGFHDRPTEPSIDGKPLPNTEETGRPVTDPRGDYRPMAFGSIGRAWQPRPTYAGTYDDKWRNNVFPFLPADFDERYYQAAPDDQQIPFPAGGEEVELRNLTPEGNTVFRLPVLNVPVEFERLGGESETVAAVLDTILLEPDKRRFMLTWRASLPLRKNMFEVPRGIVGRMSAGWYRAEETGKDWYPSLREFLAASKAGAEDANEGEELNEDEVEDEE
jgi:hypothetical protein